MRTALVFLLLASCGISAELPVRRVILYKNGVGYFERAGEVKAGDPARLEFKADEMNDVLKSLTVTDRAGGRVAGIHYDASDSLDKRLEVFPFKIGEVQPLSLFLDMFKGEQIELKQGAETMTGRIVSGRINPPHETAEGEGQKTVLRMTAQEHEQVVLLLASGELRTLDLAAVTGLRFVRPEVQRELSSYLETIAAARSREKRSVFVDSAAGGASSLVASYTVPAPVWKSSYRLLLDTKATQLEGWAIVDNTSGEDWTGVNLSLVSGRPVSFISRLYEPVYRARQTAELPEDEAVGPVIHRAVMGGNSGVIGGIAGGVPRGVMGSPPPPPPPSAKAAPMIAMAARADVASTVEVAASGRDAGELFEYSFSNPVTVRKNSSIMLPFLQQPITVRKLLIYTNGSALANPMNAAELTNNTGKTLDGGPITVFDSNTYSGEALMETLKKGDKRLISYGVDQGTRVTTKFDSGAEATRDIRLHNGILTIRNAVRETLTYTILNVDAKAKTLVIEHPARTGYKLLSQQPAEKTDSAYRFEVKLAPSAPTSFAVNEERLVDQTEVIANLGPDYLLSFTYNKALSDAGRKTLEKIAALKRDSAAALATAHSLEVQINNIFRDQERLRQNIGSLNSVAGQQEQVQTYSRTLAAQETRLVELRDQLSQAKTREQALSDQIAQLIESAEF